MLRSPPNINVHLSSYITPIQFVKHLFSILFQCVLIITFTPQIENGNSQKQTRQPVYQTECLITHNIGTKDVL